MNSEKRLYEYYRKTNRFVVCKNAAQVIKGDFNCGNNSEEVTSVLPFDFADMKLLITAYDGYVLLVEELERIFGIRLTEGCFEDLSSLKTLIQRISPLYKNDVAWGDQEVGCILADGSVSLDDAAKRLMGI